MHQIEKSMAATRPSDLKLNNRMQILELFKSGAVYSVADIAREIGISRQTVMKAIQFFLEKGIIVSEGKANSGSMGGKRAELFTLPANSYLFNILICPSCLYVSLFNFRCETIADFMREDIVGQAVDDIMDAAIEACDDLLRSNEIDPKSVRGISLATPGIIEEGKSRLRFNSLFPAWGKHVAITKKLTAHFGRNVAVLAENVARICGSAYLHECRTSHDRVATVFSRWGGIGACLMNRGFMLYGKDALIGEIGHMILETGDVEVCACGGRGCFERQVSAERMRQMAGKWMGDYPDSTLTAASLDSLTIQQIFAASAAGDPLGRKLSGYAAGHFANALRNLTLTFNPSLVVMQGDYSTADDFFRETLYRELRTFRYYVESPEANNPFALNLDTRSIQELTTLGAYTLLIEHLFCDESMYS